MNILEPVEEFAAPHLWVGVGVIFLIMCAYGALQQYKINSLKTDLAQQTLIAERYTQAIEISNKSIEQLGKDSARNKAIGADALKKQEAISTHHQKEINRLHDAIDNVKTCDEAVEIAKGLK